jgi:uncharacterized protein (DUF427 family)
MPSATWNGAVIAQTDAFELVEGNVYFPAESLNSAHLEPSDHASVCFWKSVASYYHVIVDGKRNDNAAWYYADPKAAAAQIKGHVAFWRGVRVDR